MKIKEIVLSICAAAALSACQAQTPQSAAATSAQPVAEANTPPPAVVAELQPTAASEPEKSNEEFPMSHMTWSATLLEVKGADSADATAIGKVARVNASEYCERDPGGETGGTKASIAKCIESLLAAEKGKLYSISANCIKKTMTTSHFGSFVFTGVFEDSEGFPAYPWKNENTGEMLDGGMAGGGATVDAQFALVCPSFKTWESAIALTIHSSRNRFAVRLNLDVRSQWGFT